MSSDSNGTPCCNISGTFTIRYLFVWVSDGSRWRTGRICNFESNDAAGSRWNHYLGGMPVCTGGISFAGIGRQFLQFVAAEWKGKAKQLRLEVEPDNVRAKALYERMGYKVLPYQEMILSLDEAE